VHGADGSQRPAAAGPGRGPAIGRQFDRHRSADAQSNGRSWRPLQVTVWTDFKKKRKISRNSNEQPIKFELKEFLCKWAHLNKIIKKLNGM
jgi:hypothetical protein